MRVQLLIVAHVPIYSYLNINFSAYSTKWRRQVKVSVDPAVIFEQEHLAKSTS